MMSLVEMSGQFGGLDMGTLIGGPLQAACRAQTMLAGATADFLTKVCMDNDGNGRLTAKTVNFSFQRSNYNNDGKPVMEDVNLNVPLLAVVKVPALSVDAVDITFDMEVKSSESHADSNDTNVGFDANAGLKIGPFSMNVSVKGSVASHKENTRSSDNSAKYHVEVHASQGELPEGLARVLDMMAQAVTPLPPADKESA